VDSDAARHELTEALALVQEHIAELAVVEEKRAALSATATTADGTVAVTVDVRGVVSAANVDESYLDEHDLADLGDFFTEAVQVAAGEIARKSAELLAPLAERRARFPSLADVVDGAPDIRDLLSHLRPDDAAQASPAGGDRHEHPTSGYPTVRSHQ
jgi:DNA-binding protein YbaB